MCNPTLGVSNKLQDNHRQTVHKYTNTNTQIQIHKYKYTNTITQIQIAMVKITTHRQALLQIQIHPPSPFPPSNSQNFVFTAPAAFVCFISTSTNILDLSQVGRHPAATASNRFKADSRQILQSYIVCQFCQFWNKLKIKPYILHGCQVTAATGKYKIPEMQISHMRFSTTLDIPAAMFCPSDMWPSHSTFPRCQNPEFNHLPAPEMRSLPNFVPKKKYFIQRRWSTQ